MELELIHMEMELINLMRNWNWPNGIEWNWNWLNVIDIKYLLLSENDDNEVGKSVWRSLLKSRNNFIKWSYKLPGDCTITSLLPVAVACIADTDGLVSPLVVFLFDNMLKLLSNIGFGEMAGRFLGGGIGFWIS